MNSGAVHCSVNSKENPKEEEALSYVCLEGKHPQSGSEEEGTVNEFGNLSWVIAGGKAKV